MASCSPADPSAARNDSEDDKLAAFMSNDASYFVFRRFRALNLRNLLRLQARVLSLQQQVETLKTQSSHGHVARQVEQLMPEIDEALRRYNRALIEQSNLRTLEKPESIAVTDLCAWADDHDCSRATKYLDSRDDLVTLGSGRDSKGWAYHVVEKGLWKCFAKPSPSDAIQDVGTIYLYNDNAIERTVRAILVSLATIVLLVPIIIMFFLSRGYPSLIVLVLCTALFSIILAATTDARNHEVMMAAAAYGAVLIVFLGRA